MSTFRNNLGRLINDDSVVSKWTELFYKCSVLKVNLVVCS